MHRQLGTGALLIGNLNIDLIIRNVPHLPVWGQEVLGSDHMQVSSGQSAYTAFSLRKFGIETRIISCVGDDSYGDKILADLAKGSIDSSSVERIRNAGTGITVAIVRQDGERAFVSDPSSLIHFDLDTVKRNLQSLEPISIVGVVGFFFLPRFSFSDMQYCFEKSHATGCQTMLDTGWDPDNWADKTVKDLRNVLKYVDFFIPNMDEATAITGHDTPEKAAESLLNDGCRTVLIKLGADGSYLKTEHEEIFVSAFESTVLDTVGAGDVYNAGFIFGTLQEWPYEARMIFGSATASLYISRSIDRFPDLDATIRLASGHINFNLKE